MRDSVAAALNVRSEDVKIDHWRLSPGQRSTRCWGTSLGKRFFAKTLALDPYRLVPRVAVPGKEAVANGNSCRSASEQIEAEWSMTQRLRKLVGNEAVPAPLGKSIATKTVVWEQATGARMDDSVRRSRWMDHRGNAGGAALFQAGTWLKKLHNASAHREAAINCGELIRGVRELLQSQGLSSSGYASTALQLLETARHRTGGNDLLMPTVLSHGDFTLANMLWDKKASHLWIVDFEDFAEPIGAGIDKVAGGADAGVIDEHVQPAELPGHGLGHRPAIVGRSDVGPEGLDVAGFGRKFAERVGATERAGAPAIDDDVAG